MTGIAYRSHPPTRQVKTTISKASLTSRLCATVKKNGGGEAEGCQDSAFSAICLLVSVRALQIFLLLAMTLLLSAMPARGELSTGNTYSISFVDIDGQQTFYSRRTHDHRRVDDECRSRTGPHGGRPCSRFLSRQSGLQNDYRCSFHRQTPGHGRRMATGFIRHRVREAARRLQTRYDAQKISRDAKSDIFVVTDFDGTIASQLGQSRGSNGFLCVRIWAKWGIVSAMAQRSQH